MPAKRKGKRKNRKIKFSELNYVEKNQLIPYTIEEQEQQADLFDNSKNIKIIGYYDNES